MAEDAFKVLSVWLLFIKDDDARCVNDVQKFLPNSKGVSCRLLTCRLAIFDDLHVGCIPNEDVQARVYVCVEGKPQWNGCQELKEEEFTLLPAWSKLQIGDNLTSSESIAD